jgi:hypothetical protein
VPSALLSSSVHLGQEARAGINYLATCAVLDTSETGLHPVPSRLMDTCGAVPGATFVCRGRAQGKGQTRSCTVQFGTLPKQVCTFPFWRLQLFICFFCDFSFCGTRLRVSNISRAHSRGPELVQGAGAGPVWHCTVLDTSQTGLDASLVGVCGALPGPTFACQGWAQGQRAKGKTKFCTLQFGTLPEQVCTLPFWTLQLCICLFRGSLCCTTNLSTLAGRGLSRGQRGGGSVWYFTVLDTSQTGLHVWSTSRAYLCAPGMGSRAKGQIQLLYFIIWDTAATGLHFAVLDTSAVYQPFSWLLVL